MLLIALPGANLATPVVCGRPKPLLIPSCMTLAKMPMVVLHWIDGFMILPLVDSTSSAALAFHFGWKMSRDKRPQIHRAIKVFRPVKAGCRPTHKSDWRH